MRKRYRIYITVLSICIISLLFFIGPTVSIDQNIRTFDIPENIDRYLAEIESKFSDIRPNTEKILYWAHPETKEKTHYAIIYLHGFSASRQETVPLCEILAEELEANVFYTRLSGHGRKGVALADASVNNRMNDAVEAVSIGRCIGENVIIIGTSSGGTLATWLTTYDLAPDIRALIAISPNFGPKNKYANILT